MTPDAKTLLAQTISASGNASATTKAAAERVRVSLGLSWDEVAERLRGKLAR